MLILVWIIGRGIVLIIFIRIYKKWIVYICKNCFEYIVVVLGEKIRFDVVDLRVLLRNLGIR